MANLDVRDLRTWHLGDAMRRTVLQSPADMLGLGWDGDVIDGMRTRGCDVVRGTVKKDRERTSWKRR